MELDPFTLTQLDHLTARTLKTGLQSSSVKEDPRQRRLSQSREDGGTSGKTASSLPAVGELHLHQVLRRNITSTEAATANKAGDGHNVPTLAGVMAASTSIMDTTLLHKSTTDSAELTSTRRALIISQVTMALDQVSMFPSGEVTTTVEVTTTEVDGDGHNHNVNDGVGDTNKE